MDLQPTMESAAGLAAPPVLAVRPVNGAVCELCGAGIGLDHPHLVAPPTEQVVCSCAVCSTLFSERIGARFKRVPDRAQRLDAFALSEAEWEALGLPVGLAFFVRRSGTDDVRGVYASPAGAVEATLPPAVWAGIVDRNPALTGLHPDVEALVVNRVDRAGRVTPTYLVAPIDLCYQLVGLGRHGCRAAAGDGAVDSAAVLFADLVDGAEASHD